MQRPLALTILFLAFLVSDIYAQSRLYFASPGINVGYTFGAGMNYGFKLDLGISRNENNFHKGISLSQSYVRVRKYTHRMRSFTFMAGTDYAEVRAGWGRLKNKWGYRNGNRCITYGLVLDVAFAYPNEYSAWVGIKTFRYLPSTWAWFTKPYNSVYLDYHYNAIKNPSVQQFLHRHE